MTVPLLKHPELRFGAITFFAKQHKEDTCGSNGLPLTPNSIIIFERTVVVSQYCGHPVSNLIEKKSFTFDEIRSISYQILSGLNELHMRNIVHRNLSSDNVLLLGKNIKLFNYGLYHMTDKGKLVSFPIFLANPKVDIWSLGIILAELTLNKHLWTPLKLGQRIRKVLSLLQSNSSIFERIAREHNCYDLYLEIPQDLKKIIESCLNIHPSDRPTCEELLQEEMFNCFKPAAKINNGKVYEPFEIFTINEFYHWWQLRRRRRFARIKKARADQVEPARIIITRGTILGQERNPATLYDPRIVEMPLDTLYQRFENIPFACYYPLIQCKSDIIALAEPPPYDATGLPLVIKERDPEYQFHRVILFRRLLHYLRIDKFTPTATDRQIEVDIPRCHQYNELLSSTDGHKKLKRILKAWVYQNSQYVYWQGLDSLTAPFLYLNFNDEAKAFACLSAFVPKFLHKFFLKDNSTVIEEYLSKFSQLIAFHDPVLANHLFEINFYPQLFAIPWFLTLFSHVFPLYKILHLWDKVLLGDSSYSLHIGLSVLTQLRDRLLTSGFNECILLFSDLPEVDIEKCVIFSTSTFQSTPRSITHREHENEEYLMRSELDISGVTLDELKRKDVPELVQKIFNRCSVTGSINIPFSSISFSENNIESIGHHISDISIEMQYQEGVCSSWGFQHSLTCHTHNFNFTESYYLIIT
ncbi:hypothetical protein NQ318_002682 [Aromia moschata]|uniref:TBC domain-containing protein kinase-like protein n=1 Tax=Aromia moschata TaxID=1265417 RepID=A0AAV8X807_9CUCU|nr:hypothetical protein NQ318_002682 [Aromia moschata]